MIIDARRRYLVVVAHADDETLGPGGTIARLRDAGAAVTVSVATDSTSTQYAGDAAARRRREGHFAAAMRVLGVEDFSMGPFPDMRLDAVAHVDLNGWVSEQLRRSEADTVFAHHPGDVNLDHRRLFDSTLVATRPAPGQRVRAVYCFAVGSASEWGFGVRGGSFVAQGFVDIEATLERKCEAMACYADELHPYPHPRSDRALRQLAGVTGSTVGVRAAEAFQLVRSLD